MKYTCLLLTVLTLSACASGAPPCAPPTDGDIVYVTGEGWHVEIGIPATELGESLAFYREVFPGARVIIFGYGKETFFTAPAHSIDDYILGPFPGPAVIEVFALNVTPPEAYPPEDTITLRLPPGGENALSDYIAEDLARDKTGKPRITAHGHDPESLFYAARSEYNMLHTCNGWAFAALQATGLPLSGDSVVFSGQVMNRVESAARKQCPALR